MNSQWLLHYPVWELETFGGGFWIALIATVHVYVAHFAVGGGLFLVFTEMKGYRENSPAILDYTRRHTRFFMLVSLVFGAITGVGIWFVISLLSPAATSTLIHYFLFGWATEWVFFVGEIVAIFIYYHTFGKMPRDQHLFIGFLYFIFGWLSLFVINGIITFMLTPGDWIETKNFWDGFFNPSFVPSLFFRTCMAFMLAGLFGFITSVHIKDAAVRGKMLRYCAGWLIIPFLFLPVGAGMYGATLPTPQQLMIFSKSPEMMPFFKAFIWLSPVIVVIGVLMTIRVPVPAKKVLAFTLLFIGLAYLGSFEWIREAGRRPFLIHNYSYSNAVRAEDAAAINKTGLLKSARWAENRDITPDNQMEAGKEMFNLLCISCHSVGGPMNDILPLTQKFTTFGMDSLLSGMGKINTYMPPFMGTPDERKAMAVYITEGLNQKASEPTAASPDPLPVDVPDFDEAMDEYILLAWTNKGMHAVSDSDSYFSLSAPGSDICALLIQRGELPEKITRGVEITYEVESGFETPSRHTAFWKYAASLVGKDIAPDTGISGKKTDGVMTFDESLNAYAAKGVPILPYSNDSKVNPYPLMTITASDKETGAVLISTKITIPVSTEMGCKTCHGGQWRVNKTAGISDETAEDILKVHDRLHRTRLLETAENGNPRQCQACHGENQKDHQMNLSAAIHGFHANYLTNQGPDACMTCHPGDGFTRGFRGIHRELELNCINCHGTLEEHALGLLKAENAAGKKGVQTLMKPLLSAAGKDIGEIAPRKPWINAPDCLHCHVDFTPPETDTVEIHQRTASERQLYQMRTDDAGIRCAACHGAAHAICPADNIFGNDRDNIVPMQYQQMPYPMGANKNCRVCHTIDMEDEFHHANSLNMFRNVR